VLISPGLVLMVLARLLVPLSILRWPVAGVLASMAADALDVVFVHVLSSERWRAAEDIFATRYVQFDKTFDTYYLALVLIVSLRWPDPLARRTSVALFAWRVAGLIPIYLSAQNAWMLLVFPNVFENFYLLRAIAPKISPGWEIRTKRRLVVALAVATVPKLIQEYYFHVVGVTPWPWVRRTLFG
jgi:hypothetical protein